ncbi:WXG100 family type VII secretion target [Nocardia sp. NPDC060256]|uniref:WXG100 family type VII secretion target n=1 Tax=unclassified Nocardia TaxID=2637762 RepID=UPI00364BB9DC
MALTNLGGSGNAVGQDAAGVGSVVNDIHVVIEKLRKSVQAVEHSAIDAKNGWQGIAAKKFHDVVDAWSHESDDLNNELTNFNTAIDEGSKYLTQVDES